MDECVSLIYDLDECLEWILVNNFKRIAIQFSDEDIKYSTDIVSYLKGGIDHRRDSSDFGDIQFYTTRPNTCCIDLIVTQHVTNLDAIVHIGLVCLSAPYVNNKHRETPVLFIFKRSVSSETDFISNSNNLLAEIRNLSQSSPRNRLCVLYDTSLVDYASRLQSLLAELGDDVHIDVAKLFCPSQQWSILSRHNSTIVHEISKTEHLFSQYVLPESIRDYDCTIYLGKRLSISITLDCPPKLYKIDCYCSLKPERVNATRLLNKRMALVDRVSNQEELRIGVILTNPLPNVNQVMQRLESYAKQRKHILYFITMIQTIDECKIGNFDLCDAFIVVNSCTCSTVLESLVFNRPIITELEFKIACGFEAEYGRVIWPGSSSQLSADEMINNRKLSDVSSALIHTRNELLERCSQARADKWSGLSYSKVTENEDVDNEESLVVAEGLKGIASSYASEPIARAEDGEAKGGQG